MIALITPTGDRPAQMELCARWMNNQTYKGDVLWIIIDDAEPVTIDFIKDDFRENWIIKKLYPKPAWKNGQNTQARNLIAGVEELERYNNITHIFFIEDDDYYTPTYIERMLPRVYNYIAAGQIRTIYFHVLSLDCQKHKNVNNSSLFQMVLDIRGLSLFKEILHEGKKTYIDIELCKRLKRGSINLFDGIDLSIGIKGMPGRKGIGFGHKTKMEKVNRLQKLMVLRNLIGIDYLYYLPYML